MILSGTLDSAGVEQPQLRIPLVFGELVPLCRQQARHVLRVRIVVCTAPCLDVDCLGT